MTHVYDVEMPPWLLRDEHELVGGYELNTEALRARGSVKGIVYRWCESVKGCAGECKGNVEGGVGGSVEWVWGKLGPT